MAVRLIIFPDTNVFLQCRALNEVPWSEITQAEEIELLIGAPVQDEIDRLKSDGNLRRARRAREANSLFRGALASAGESVTVRESEPRVTLRFAPLLPPKRETPETLDLARADDRLLDEVMHYRRIEPSAKILSNDTGMMLRARRHGVLLIAVPESWLLPPEKDERERQIEALRAEVAGLRNTEAVLSLSLADEQGRPIEAIGGPIPLYPDLAVTEIAGLIDAIRRCHPEAKSFSSATVPPTNPELPALRLPLESMFPRRAPSTEQIARYHKEYEVWIGKVHKLLEQLGSSLNIRPRIRKIQLTLSNTSARPADEVLLELKMHGNATLLAAVGNDVPALVKQAEKLPVEVLLPHPPTPPKGENLYETLARGFGPRDWATKLRTSMPDYSGFRSSLPRRDRHEFYRREDDEKPTAETSFACAEFRHQRAPEVFALWIFIPLQSEIVKARVHIRASARNMRTPVDLHVSIDVDSERRSTYEVAEKWRIDEEIS